MRRGEMRGVIGTRFGCESMTPSKLAAIARAMKFKGAPDGYRLARDHTHFPFIALTMTKTKAELLLERMVIGSNTTGCASGFNGSALDGNGSLRACPMCIRDDIRNIRRNLLASPTPTSFSQNLL